MNKVVLSGRLVRDPEVRYSSGESQLCVAKYTLAVDRRFSKGSDNSQSADFIRCTAFGKSGEFVEKYLKKGMKMIVSGRIQTGSYDNKDGQKVYTTDVIVEEHEFAESKKSSDSLSDDYNDPDDGFENLDFGGDIEGGPSLPF